MFLFISHCRRKLVHLDMTAHPTADWVWRQLIKATPWGEQPKHLIRDRDYCHGESFNAKAASLAIEAMLTTIQGPKANAVAERVVGTLRRECLDHAIVINERQLLRVVQEYMVHHNTGRPHRSLDRETPTGPPARAGSPEARRIVDPPVLGGLHHEYEWVAA